MQRIALGRRGPGQGHFGAETRVGCAGGHVASPANHEPGVAESVCIRRSQAPAAIAEIQLGGDDEIPGDFLVGERTALGHEPTAAVRDQPHVTGPGLVDVPGFKLVDPPPLVHRAAPPISQAGGATEFIAERGEIIHLRVRRMKLDGCDL